ncbi:MAG: zinc ribbon domain-containing protein [Chloroflexi bacterium]|jgi:putative FmdB family regulatory protein|nr:zinc ribbon domain-containing protein [Chloroflexota bacterium]MBT7081665.1 zinc ribbon domain-containing protein [Chloroflexota bacterium]MBT7290526.1 zinc ribbon domain-containing protein [Chloroflexota bacterium]
MPIYEYICNECNSKNDVLVRDIKAQTKQACPNCGNTKMQRIISSFAYHQSEGMRREASGAPQQNAAQGGINDPRDIGRWTENKLSGMGIDIRSGEHKDAFAGVRNMIDKARTGDMSVLDKKAD